MVQVREEQEEALAQQDAGLDMLHDIVVRQKGMGHQIFREVGRNFFVLEHPRPVEAPR